MENFVNDKIIGWVVLTMGGEVVKQTGFQKSLEPVSSYVSSKQSYKMTSITVRMAWILCQIIQ